MHELADAGSWAQLVGASVVLLLGAFVLLLRSRTRATVAFGAFAVFFGGQFVLTNAGNLWLDQSTLDGAPWFEGIRLALRALALLLLVPVAWLFPASLSKGERWLLALPAASTVAVVSLGVAVASGLSPLGAASLLTFEGVLGFLAGLPAFLALRAMRRKDADLTRQFALVAASVLLYVGVVATAGPVATRARSILDPTSTPLVGAVLAFCILSSVLWLRAGARGQARRPARNVALLGVLMPLAGLAYVALELDWGVLGLVRVAMVAVLTYGIARHQLLGLDVKLRLALKGSTLAAMFLGVLFVVANVAQNYFGAEYGILYGGAAAGTLFFAMAPLQRVAERVAQKAIPLPAPEGPGAPAGAREADRLRAYRHFASRLAADGEVSAEDRRALAVLADEWRLGAVAAHDALAAAEAEAAARRRGGSAARALRRSKGS